MSKEDDYVHGTARFIFGILLLSIALSTIESSISVGWVLILLTVVGSFLTVWGFIAIKKTL